jgi:uncharacterized repeat protein (TIGR03803 family)
MRRKSFLRIIIGIFATLALTFMLTGSSWAQIKYKTLHKFTNEEGSYPNQRLTFDMAGNLFGATCRGGAYGAGGVFKLAPDPGGSWTESSVYDFTGGDDGSCSHSGLIFDDSGDLYGTTDVGGSYGAGVVFELVPGSDGSWTETVLYAFTGGADGSYPDDPRLTFDAQGALYGTTDVGGSYGAGVVFKLTPNGNGSWAESVLYSFTGGKDGGHPVTGLTFDSAGALYGTTCVGGAHGNGVLFKLTPNEDGSWTESVLHTFAGGKDGAYPTGWLTSDAAGNLYGSTDIGGLYGDGVVFKLAPTPPGRWKIVHQFTGEGRLYWGGCGLTFDTAGNLYGTRIVGGPYGYGIVFKLTPTSSGGWSYHVLHAFKDMPAAYPDGGVIFDSSGNIYGTTSGDGSKTFGSVYEITP